MSDPSAAELSEILAKAFGLSVRAGDRVVLLTTHIYNSRLIEAARTALSRLQTDFVHLELPPRAEDLRPSQPLRELAIRAMNEASIVIRPTANTQGALFPPTPEVYEYHPSFNRIFLSGTRWLDLMLDPPAIWRLFPSPAMIERTIRGAERMEKAEVIQVKSAAGTNLTVRKTGRKGVRQAGVVDQSCVWDNFGFGMVYCAPLEDSANGTLVISPGDRAGHIFDRTKMDRERTVLRFEEGLIVSIDGGTDATFLRQRLESFKSKEVYRIAHIGWGTQEKATWGGPNFTFADWESYYGSFTVHFGVNTFDTPARHSGLGGKVPAGTYHWGGSHLNHSLWLDDELIVENGNIVAPDLR